MTWIAVFTATVIADFCWARWALHLGEGHRMRASIYSALIVLVSGFAIVEYTTDHTLLIPAALGAAIGTWFAIR